MVPQLKEVEAVIPLLQLLHNSPDLMEKLDVVFDNLHTLSQLDERVTAFEAVQELTANRVSGVEQDVTELQRRLNSLTVVDSTKPQGQSVLIFFDFMCRNHHRILFSMITALLPVTKLCHSDLTISSSSVLSLDEIDKTYGSGHPNDNSGRLLILCIMHQLTVVGS